MANKIIIVVSLLFLVSCTDKLDKNSTASLHKRLREWRIENSSIISGATNEWGTPDSIVHPPKFDSICRIRGHYYGDEVNNLRPLKGGHWSNNNYLYRTTVDSPSYTRIVLSWTHKMTCYRCHRDSSRTFTKPGLIIWKNRTTIGLYQKSAGVLTDSRLNEYVDTQGRLITKK